MTHAADKHPVLTAFLKAGRNLRAMATRLLGDEDDADDALQEAFIRLWVRRESIRSADEAAALMATTVRHLSIDTLRRRSAAATCPLDEERDAAPDETAAVLQAEADERFNEVQALIESRLSPVQRKILQMRDYEERSYDDIAQTLHMLPTAVRMQLSRARKTVRTVWQAQQTGQPTTDL